jgi:endonuclease-3
MTKPIPEIIKALEKVHGKSEVPPIVSGHPAVFRMLVQTILAARNTDENALAAAKELFARYKTPAEIAKAPIPTIEKLVKRGVFYRMKAKSIKALSQILVDKYKGRVPKTMEELVELPGVGRKTANIILSYAYGKAEGIAVDTHVFRLVNRIGIVNEKTPEKTEFALLKIVPKQYWLDFNRVFVMHGREICFARKPACDKCPLTVWCDFYNKNVK